MTATELARNLSRVLDRLQHDRDEVLVTRNNHVVARIVPGTASMTAREAFSDIQGILDADEGGKWLDDLRSFDQPVSRNVRDRWE